MSANPTRPYKCGVCVGYGAWYKATGQPVNQDGLAPREDVQTCHYCHGTGRLEQPVFGEPQVSYTYLRCDDCGRADGTHDLEVEH